MKKETIRNSNHELMRIISMFFIVLGHVLLFGKFLNTTDTELNTFYRIIEYILLIHVSSFAILTGYYQSKTSIKQSKIWQLLNQVWFYKLLFLIIFTILGMVSISKIDLLKELTPFPYNYWYLKCYILLYLTSPFLNKLINVLNQKEFKTLIFTGFFIFCILPAISGGELFDNNGYTLYQFVYLYFVGAYLRIYPIEKSYHFKRTSKELFRLIMILIFFFCVILNYLIYSYGVKISNTSEILDYISKLIGTSTVNYSNPITTVQAIAYFSFFTTLSIKSKFINRCSSLTLGVYIIHENIFLRNHLYQWLGFNGNNINKSYMIIHIFLATIIIYVACSIIEFIRQIVFKFLYNRKFLKKYREQYYNWFNKVIQKENNNS